MPSAFLKFAVWKSEFESAAFTAPASNEDDDASDACSVLTLDATALDSAAAPATAAAHTANATIHRMRGGDPMGRRGTRVVDLDAVVIGGRERRPIVIAEYNPAWPLHYERERTRIADALGDIARMIEHVGSTAVPGLAAKPIVDILVAVENPDDDAALVPPLQRAGYELRVREPGHRMFRTPTRDVHVHVWRDGDEEARRQLLFRDQLRRSGEHRRAYERLKRELATRQWRDMNDYADAKSGLIVEILAAARG